jgi:DNA polymerase-1
VGALDNIDLNLVRSYDDVQRFMQWLGERRQFLAIDTETEGLNVGRDQIRLMQFGDGTAGWAFDYKDWRALIKEVIESYDRPTVCHNLLYDSKMLRKDGVTIPQRHANDTMVMSFLDNPASKIGLKAMAARRVDRRAAFGQNILGQAMSAGGWSWATIPIDHPAYWQYGVLDTCLTSLLAEKLYPETAGGKYKQAYDLELACIHVLREAEIAGMQIDPVYCRLATEKLERELDDLRPQIPISNPGSDVQVRNYLLELGCPLFVKTEAGALSVAKDVLQWLAPNYPVATLIEAYRSKQRMLSNYFHKFEELEVDGRVHCSTKPVGARTGRMTVTDPALQTLPRGRLVRDAFIPSDGCTIVQADFNGMEMRALASMAKEQNMLAAFARGEDLHNFVASSVYGANYTKANRQTCKSAGFAKIYGAGIEQFSVTAGISVAEGASFLERYDMLFPGVRLFQEAVAMDVVIKSGGRRKMGYVELIDGRHLPVEADKAYKGVNFKIQGSCAVSTKEKIVELDHAGIGEFFRLAVHDELLFDVPIPEVEEVRAIIKEVMPDRHNFPGVTLTIETDTITRWGEHYPEYDKYIDMEALAA